MTSPAAVRYARVDGASLAYQTWGDGPANVVVVPPMAQNIELAWERPEFRHMFARLGSFARTLHFDKRGTGASDRTLHMPTMDERVEDLAAVMDHAGVGRAHLMGVSEGGPVALLFAATYPARVAGVVLVCSGARIVPDEDAADRTARRKRYDRFVQAWGTEESLTLDRFAPSVAADASYRAWEPRYERQSASPAAIGELLEMMNVSDVRPVLAAITAPTLVLHRRGDRILPIELAREAAAGLPDARLVELDGEDHFAQVGDVDAWLDHVERFTTGSVTARQLPPAASRVRARIRTMGGFVVLVNGDEPVALSTWGSQRARQLCKRLAVAAGEPVPRDELIEMLWPDEVDVSKLGARLSVLLSNVRRVLGGGVAGDRAAVSLDLAAVELDVHDLYDAAARGDDAGVISAYRGVLLPEDAYDDWAITARDRLQQTVAAGHRRLAARATSAGQHDEAAEHAAAMLNLDPYDERAHETLVKALQAGGHVGDATRAQDHYRRRMKELGVRPQLLIS